MDWKAITTKNLEVKKEKVEISVKHNNLKIEEDEKCVLYDPDFNFDYEYSDECYDSINKFKRYINRMNEPLFDSKDDYTTNLYNFIKYNSYEYMDIIRKANSTDNDIESSDDDYYDENF
jgi:hypothetical protein